MNNRFRFNCFDKSSNTYMKDIQNSLDLNGVLANDNYIVLQYTGLFDKNNNPIVEGDIVRKTFMDEGREVSDLMTIVYDDKTCAFGLKLNNEIMHIVNYDFIKDNFDVVGNIFENPNLLDYARHEMLMKLSEMGQIG